MLIRGLRDEHGMCLKESAAQLGHVRKAGAGSWHCRFRFGEHGKALDVVCVLRRSWEMAECDRRFISAAIALAGRSKDDRKAAATIAIAERAIIIEARQ